MPTKNPLSNEKSAANTPEPRHGTHFVGKMFSGFGHESEFRPSPPQPTAEEPYRALHQSAAPAGASYRLPSPSTTSRVHALSPATEVMTDLTQVKAVTIPPVASVDEANQAMIRHGVRSLFVIGEAEAILGIVTSIDILGEKPIQVSQERGLGHAEVLVQQVMTPAAQLEAVELRDVQRARVGDIVETLKRSGRQHALVIDGGTVEHASTARTVRGIFSLSQIAKQLGLPPQVGRGAAKTFAEIEAAIAR